MDKSWNSKLKLKKILKEEVSVDKGIREALKSWDNLGADQLVLHRIENFKVKAAKQEGKQDKGTSAMVNKITRDVVIVKDVDLRLGCKLPWNVKRKCCFMCQY